MRKLYANVNLLLRKFVKIEEKVKCFMKAALKKMTTAMNDVLAMA